jgi:NAD(P)-dependent dehydrogenase (short-subunit alcohol dehydrogenase family)
MSDFDPSALSRRFGLDGRIAVVTGASRGVGAAIATGLTEAGALVYGLSRTAVAPAGVSPLACDLADAAAVAGAFATILRQAGRLHVLVNAAAISLPAPKAGMEAEIERFRQTVNVDLLGAYACISAALPLLRNGGGGSVINVTSINSVRGFPGNPGYVAAKAGLAGLTRALAIDLAPDRIRVNSLAPGYVRTAMTEASYADPVRHEERRRHTLLGRWGTPDDIVGAAIFLASDASAYVTGQELIVDGGWTVNGLVSSGGISPA